MDLCLQGGRIATVLLTVPCRDEDVVAQLQPKGHDVDGRIALGLRRGNLGLFDSQGVRVVQADESPEVYQWFVLRSLRDLPDEMRECTTRTINWHADLRATHAFRTGSWACSARNTVQLAPCPFGAGWLAATLRSSRAGISAPPFLAA